MECTTGNWKIDRSNTSEAEAFMKNVGMPDEMVKKHLAREYVVQYKVDGSKMEWTVSVTNDPSLGSQSAVIEMGVEKEVTGLDKEKTKVLVKFEGGKFMEHYDDLTNGGAYDIIREVSGDVMSVTTTSKGHSYIQKWLRC